MATVTKTFTENDQSSYHSKWTVSVTGTDQTVSEDFTITPPDVKAKYVYSGKTKGSVAVTLRFSIGNRSNIEYDNRSASGDDARMSSGTTYTIPTKDIENTDVSLAQIFNTGNRTSRTVDLIASSEKYEIFLRSSNASESMSRSYTYEGDDFTWGKVSTITLDVPPTFDVSEPPSGPFYAGIHEYSINISNSAAYYGGEIASSKLTIGNQETVGNGDGTLSVALMYTGTYTPKVTVIDSRGQEGIIELPPITVMTYAVSVSNENIERIDDNSFLPEDTGTNAIITSRFSYPSFEGNYLLKPDVKVDGITTSNITWYTSYSSNTGFSGEVSWGGVIEQILEQRTDYYEFAEEWVELLEYTPSWGQNFATDTEATISLRLNTTRPTSDSISIPRITLTGGHADLIEHGSWDRLDTRYYKVSVDYTGTSLTIKVYSYNNIPYPYSMSDSITIIGECFYVDSSSAPYAPESPITLYGKLTDTFDTDTSYTVSVTANTKYGGSEAVATVLPQAFYLLVARAGGHGLGIGMKPPTDDLYIDMNAYMKQDVEIDGDVTAGTITIGEHDSPIGTRISGVKRAAWTDDTYSIPDSSSVFVYYIDLPPGSWILTGYVRFASNSAGSRRIGFSTNSAAGTNPISVSIPAGAGAIQLEAVSMAVVSSETTRYYMHAYQSSGGSLNVTYGNLHAMRIA